ncbi:MAG TPA: ABC transporter permease [Candidatus Limnocylindria bacterium]
MKIGPIDLEWIAENLDQIGELVVEHIYLTLLAIGIGMVISFGLALVIRRWKALQGPIIGATATLYVIPSLAMFALLVPITGLTSIVTAEIALVSYTLLILTRNTVEGLNGVPDDTVEAATGVGYTPMQRLFRVELPLALPVIVAGIRIATVTTIGLVTVTALIGFGGLGYLIVTIGINRGSFGITATLTGVVLVVALAIVADLALLALQRALTPWARRRAG